MGLPLPPNQCPCGVSVDLYGHHRINCKQSAGRVWKAAHDTQQLALAYECRRLQLSVVDNDAHLRRDFTHLTSHKRGDLAINAQSTDFQILTRGNIPRSQFIVDVHINAMVNTHGHWGGSYHPQTDSYVNTTLIQKENAKKTKHASHYENIGFGFIPFVVFCFAAWFRLGVLL